LLAEIKANVLNLLVLNAFSQATRLLRYINSRHKQQSDDCDA